MLVQNGCNCVSTELLRLATSMLGRSLLCIHNCHDYLLIEVSGK